MKTKVGEDKWVDLNKATGKVIYEGPKLVENKVGDDTEWLNLYTKKERPIGGRRKLAQLKTLSSVIAWKNRWLGSNAIALNARDDTHRILLVRWSCARLKRFT